MKYLFIIVALLFNNNVSAQESNITIETSSTPNPPVNLEATFGQDGMTYQLMVNKKLKSIPKLGLFSITNLISSWEKGPYDGIMSQGLLTYRILKGLDIAAGFHYTDVTGARPSAGLIYSYAVSDFLIVANPRIDLYKDAISETMIFVEYTPKINDEWKLYNRIQGLYGFTVNSGEHARSYILARSGISIKEFNFGLAATLDWFGPQKGNQNNFGVFVSTSLF